MYVVMYNVLLFVLSCQGIQLSGFSLLCTPESRPPLFPYIIMHVVLINQVVSLSYGPVPHSRLHIINKINI